MGKEKNVIISRKLNKPKQRIINYLKKNDVEVKQIEKQDEFLINLKGVEMQGKNEFERTMLKFVESQLEFNKNQLEFNKNQLEFNKDISKKLETIIVKNNLKT